MESRFVCDRSSDWLHTAKQLCWQYDWWCMMVDVVMKSSCFHASPHGVSVLSGLIALCTKIIFKLLDVKVVWECWLKSFFIENAVVAVMFFCLLFKFLQTNKQIVKLKHWKRKKINQQPLSRISRLCFFNLNNTDFYSNGPWYFFNTPELTGKACAPSPDGWIDWEMTEEEDIKKGKYRTAWINDCIYYISV